jgi:fused signal recognition particle receptor
MMPIASAAQLLGQVPEQPPGNQPFVLFPGLPGGTPAQVAVLAAGLLVLLLLIWLTVRALGRRRRRRVELEKKKELPALPQAPPRVEVHLPPSEAEAKQREEARLKREAVEALERQRKELAEAAKAAAGAAERARLEAEARAVKEREQEAKRDEYQAKKAADREAKERHQRERAEQERLSTEATRKAEEEAKAAQRVAEEAARRRIEAEAGRTLAQGLDKTRTQGFMARLNAMFVAERTVDDSVLAELEEVLFTADIGVRTASSLVELAREKLRQKELSNIQKVKETIRSEIERIVSLPVPKSLEGGGPPHVVMVVGVNGAGKTTTIGKLAAKLTSEGKKVVLAAGDTFRAAATEQLDVWAERAKAELVKGAENADPGSVAFDAVKRGIASGAAAVIADTAGRLHTKAPLMEEIKKVRRVMDKALPGAPHEVLLILDATNGQNAIQQAKLFQEAVGVTGIALTKLDGTAKGGVIIGICDELKIPVVWVGVGETISDLRRFDPAEFVSALFD